MDDLRNEKEERLKETLGSLLKRTRQSRHDTLAEAAESTRIHILSLQALEEDDFEKLPAEVFVRGFIKLYAKYLDLNPQEALSLFASQEGSDPSQLADAPYLNKLPDGELMAEPLSLIRKNGKIITVILLLATLVLFYALGIFFKSAEPSRPGQTTKEVVESLSSNEPYTVEEQATQALITETETKPVPEISEGQGEENKTGQSLQSIAEQEKKLSSAEPSGTFIREKPSPDAQKQEKSPTVSSVQGQQSLPVTVKVSTKPVAVPPGAEKRIRYILEASFEESSPVAVKVDDEPEKKYLSQAGIVRIWKASSKISLSLGNPSAVTLLLNGRPIPASYLADSTSTLHVPTDLPTNLLP